MDKKIIGKDPRSSIRLPDFSETEPDLESHYKSTQADLDNIWDGETITDDKTMT